MAFVYKITNKLNNSSYIGWTGKSVQERWKEHKFYALNKKSNRKFYNAIKKYGTECWDIYTLLEVNTIEEAKNAEIKFIKEYNTYYNGYNATFGGDGNNGIVMSSESNHKRSVALKGKKKPIGFNINRKHSDTTKIKISKSHEGKKKPWVKWSDTQIKKRSIIRRSLTKEQYENMLELRKSGFTTKYIANHLKVSNDIIKKWIHKEW